MKVYLAAMYKWMDRMKVEREKFRHFGFDVTAQWIDNTEDAKERHDAAQMDLEDIDRADVLVLYTLDHGTMFSSGGRMVEFGYALAQRKWVIVVGDRENVFCHLNYVCVVPTTEDAINVLLDLRMNLQREPQETMQ